VAPVAPTRASVDAEAVPNGRGDGGDGAAVIDRSEEAGDLVGDVSADQVQFVTVTL